MPTQRVICNGLQETLLNLAVSMVRIGVGPTHGFFWRAIAEVTIDDSLREQMAELRRRDPSRKVFGASKHQYRSTPVSLDEVERLESALGVPLPPDYRRFLLDVGYGAGPYYGVWSLAESQAEIQSLAKEYEAEEGKPIHPAASFPLTVDDLRVIEAIWRACGGWSGRRGRAEPHTCTPNRENNLPARTNSSRHDPRGCPSSRYVLRSYVTSKCERVRKTGSEGRSRGAALFQALGTGSPFPDHRSRTRIPVRTGCDTPTCRSPSGCCLNLPQPRAAGCALPWGMLSQPFGLKTNWFSTA